MARNHQKAFLGSPEQRFSKIKSDMFSSEFDEAACRFFKKYNGSPPIMSLHDFLAHFERAVIFGTLANLNGCQRSAARFLKLKNTTLNRKVKVQNIRFAKIPLLPTETEDEPETKSRGGSK